ILYILFFFFFFFSSRRRHTRSYGDWSSDVCSSDLQAVTMQSNRRHFLRNLTLGSVAASLTRLTLNAAEAKAGAGGFLLKAPSMRSEERRVGKECRCRRWEED